MDMRICLQALFLLSVTLIKSAYATAEPLQVHGQISAQSDEAASAADGALNEQVGRLLEELKNRNADSSISKLVRIGTPAVPSLIEGLTSKNPLVRQRAARALGLIGDTRAIQPLQDLASDSYQMFARQPIRR